MIRDVYNASSKILITAPSRFGKSTNLDMVKRFFEIEADARAIAKPVHTTDNYKLFKKYNLEICKDTNFFKEHFGKYPVVHIGFKPLGHVDKSGSILDALKMIAKNSFNQHYYILQHSLKEHVFNEITGFDEDDFRKCVSGITKDVDEVYLANSFNRLSIILERIFKKKVFVLIDSYDAFLESPLFGNNTDRDKLMSFVESSIGQLLNNVNCVERMLITGVIPVMFGGFLCSENNIERYHFLDSHPFTKYYGLTSTEVDTVLSKVIECDEERSDVRNMINDYYDAYGSCNPDTRRVYNVCSVLQYVSKRRVKSYWCERRYVDKYKKCFKIMPIRQKLEELLLGTELELDMSQPLTMANVLKVYSMITSDEVEDLSVEEELLLVLLYHFGYLSVINESDRGVICIKIPSEEIKYELAKAVLDENREFFSSPHVNGVLSALDAFQPDATDLDQYCEILRENVYNLYRDLKCQLEIIEVLYMNLITSSKYSRVVSRKVGRFAVRRCVLLKNKHQVAIYVTYYDVQRPHSVHRKVTNDSVEENIFGVFNDVPDKVLITLACDGGMLFFQHIKTGERARILPLTCTP